MYFAVPEIDLVKSERSNGTINRSCLDRQWNFLLHTGEEEESQRWTLGIPRNLLWSFLSNWRYHRKAKVVNIEVRGRIHRQRSVGVALFL